jgi:hypothetical protein
LTYVRTSTTTVTVHLDDSDHDFLPDSWETGQFGNPAQSGADDFDLDGLSNRAEFVFGSLATDPNSFPRPEATGTSNPPTAQFRFRVRNAAPATSYTLLHLTDRLTWTPLAPRRVRDRLQTAGRFAPRHPHRGTAVHRNALLLPPRRRLARLSSRQAYR